LPDADGLVRQAHERYGASREAAVEGGSFVLVDYEHAPALFRAARSLVRRGAANYAQGWFGPLPSAPVFILVFSTARGFADYRQAHYDRAGDAKLGGYQRATREIAVDASAGEKALPTILHEMLHPIEEDSWNAAPVPAGSDGRAGSDIPRWLNECVASVYESPRWDAGGGLHGAKWSLRLRLLEETLADPAKEKTAQVDALFGMSDAEFLGDDPSESVEAVLRDRQGAETRMLARQRLHYAVARYLCLWLEERTPSLLVPFYRAFREQFAADPTGRSAFEEVVGKPPAAIQGEWEAWVARP
jgi:hypothetical protein